MAKVTVSFLMENGEEIKRFFESKESLAQLCGVIGAGKDLGNHVAPVQQTPVQQAPEELVPEPTQASTPQATYTLDDLTKACAPLAAAGNLAPLQELLGKFGVAALPQLDKSQYGAFAEELKKIGADI